LLPLFNQVVDRLEDGSRASESGSEDGLFHFDETIRNDPSFRKFVAMSEFEAGLRDQYGDLNVGTDIRTRKWVFTHAYRQFYLSKHGNNLV
jgi:hypothetical protein